MAGNLQCHCLPGLYGPVLLLYWCCNVAKVSNVASEKIITHIHALRVNNSAARLLC